MNDPYLIAEIGINHNGSLNIAKELILTAKDAGFDAVKFQKRTVNIVYTEEFLDQHRESPFGDTQRAQKEGLEFSLNDYEEIDSFCKEIGIEWGFSAWDVESQRAMRKFDCAFNKLASPMLWNKELISEIASEGRYTFVSTGMSSLEEIDNVVQTFRDHECPFELMHTVSEYPLKQEDANLRCIDLLRKRYGCKVGYSGHEIGFLPTLVAVSMGAELVERHYTLDNKMVGFDHKMSLDPDELKNMVQQIRLVEKICGSGRKEISEVEWTTRKKYHVSMVSLKAIRAGDLLNVDSVTYRNPGTGIPRKDANKVLGRVVKQDIPEDVLLSEDMFE